jgi:type III restriction enzyme
MALHTEFPTDPHAILDPAIRWFPADESMREKRMDQLMPPLVATLRPKTGTRGG